MNKFKRGFLKATATVLGVGVMTGFSSGMVQNTRANGLNNDFDVLDGKIVELGNGNKSAATLDVISINADKVNRLRQVVNVLSYVVSEYEKNDLASGFTLKEYENAKRDLEIAIEELNIAYQALETENGNKEQTAEIISKNQDKLIRLQPMLEVLDYVIDDYERNKELSIITKNGYEQAKQEREQVVSEIEIAKKGLEEENKNTNEAKVITQKKLIEEKYRELLSVLDYAIAEYEKNGNNGLISEKGYNQAKKEREALIVELENVKNAIANEKDVFSRN